MIQQIKSDDLGSSPPAIKQKHKSWKVAITCITYNTTQNKSGKKNDKEMRKDEKPDNYLMWMFHMHTKSELFQKAPLSFDDLVLQVDVLLVEDQRSELPATYMVQHDAVKIYSYSWNTKWQLHNNPWEPTARCKITPKPITLEIVQWKTEGLIFLAFNIHDNSFLFVPPERAFFKLPLLLLTSHVWRIDWNQLPFRQLKL